MLKIHLFSIFTIKTPWALNREDTDKCTLSITYSSIETFGTSTNIILVSRTLTQIG